MRRKPRSDKSGYTIKELLSLEMPEEQFYVDRLVPTEGMTILAGETGIGKSHLMIHIILSIVTEVPALGCLETTPCRIQVFTEDDEYILKPYINRIQKHFKLNDMEFEDMVNIQPEVFQMYDMQERVQAFNPDVVFIDPISHIADLKNENDNTLVYKFLYDLKHFCNESEVGLVFTRHLSKRQPNVTYSEENVYDRVLGAQAWKSVPYNRIIMWRDAQYNYKLSGYSKLGSPFNWELEFDKDNADMKISPEHGTRRKKQSEYTVPILMTLERYKDGVFKPGALHTMIERNGLMKSINRSALKKELRKLANQGKVKDIGEGRYMYCAGIGDALAPVDEPPNMYVSPVDLSNEDEEQ